MTARHQFLPIVHEHLAHMFLDYLRRARGSKKQQKKDVSGANEVHIAGESLQQSA